ncbi:hypothetical protein QBC32DRAFT_401820 [Pseudoneurospora amorphoporcata]|uniref:Uncharacterized protein n=1 Tax=Pseudoneurospora amorphoporcata TaxID=241081 RepID=A0AAN6NNU2_9PEZI|nr:hypothetical protein QBC32DRAFT_401820 [Pseudoneurospora amorphoporcata]
MNNAMQRLVPSGGRPSPQPQSLADKRSQTLRRLLHGYGSLDVATITEPLSPHFMHEVLPQSLGMPVRGKADFAHHASTVFSAFKSFEMKPVELWDDPEKGQVILRCEMEGVLKPHVQEKTETDGGKKDEETGQAKEGRNGKGDDDEQTEKEVIPHVEVEDEDSSDESEYSSDEGPDLESVDPSDTLGNLALPSPPSPGSQPMPGTVLSPVTEVTEPPSEDSTPSSAFNLSQASSQEEQTPSSPPTSAEDSRHASPPPAAAQEKPQEESLEQNPEATTSSNTTELHWTNECLLIVSFTPCGSQVLKIQEFVDSAKAVEMMKKHAPKGFDQASAPPPPTYKPVTYIDLDTLKLKHAYTSVTVTEVPPSPLPSVLPSLACSMSSSLRTSPCPQHAELDRDDVHILDSGVQCGALSGMDDGLDILGGGNAYSTSTEYPSSPHRDSLILDRVGHGWHQDSAGGEEEEDAKHDFQGGVGQIQNPSAHRHPSRGLSRTDKRCKKLRFASRVEDIGFSSGSSSCNSSTFESVAACDGGNMDFLDAVNDKLHVLNEENMNTTRREKGSSSWRSTIADTIEVINRFVPSRLIPVDVDQNTRTVAVKKEWVSGATFVVGFALGKLVFGRGGLGGGLGGGARGGGGVRGGGRFVKNTV